MKTTPKWMILAVLAGIVVLAGCAKNKPEDTTKPPDAGGTEVTDGGGFGSSGPVNADPNNQGGIDSTTMEGEAKVLQDKLRPIFFAFDKYDLSQESRDTLTANAQALRAHPKFNIWIEGHCDERGTNEYNLALGDRRARASRDFLVAAGVEASRMTVISYGEERPTVQGHDESAWSQNRRANFTVKGQGIGL